MEKTFAAAGVSSDRDKLSFEEFRTVVETDSNMLAWFESLGSVF